MNAEELISKYLNFFEEKGHAVIKSAPLIPENDASVLFTTAGMHPLIPFLLGQPHPEGRRLVNVQKCIRTGDIEEVGDDTHLTFFEMLGNWSLGDYFKEESLRWSYEFLTNELGLDESKLHATVFAGNEDAPRDEESARIWRELGMPEESIHYLPKSENWWEIKTGGPCGPDSEIFYDVGKEPCSEGCKPGCDCGKYVELWNNVFMEYEKKSDGEYEPLSQKNVDTGMGLERTIAILQDKESVYDTELFQPLINMVVNKVDEIELSEEGMRSVRIIVDHVKAATLILGDEKSVPPSNEGRGYVLRRLIRRAIRHCKQLSISGSVCEELSKEVIKIYDERYSLSDKKNFILENLKKEADRFSETLEKGLEKFEYIIEEVEDEVSGEDAFLLYQSFGFPIEITQELAEEKGLEVDIKGFKRAFEEHKRKSRKGSSKRFKSGLSDDSDATVKLHTATHLLGESLRRVLGENVHQEGSNINPERLRYDFNFKRGLTDEEIKQVQNLVNEKIEEGLEVRKEKMSLDEAKSIEAEAQFMDKYGEKVFVYFINEFSKEVCAGPHVKNTKELSHFKIVKESSIGAGKRRIRAVLE